MKKLLLLIIMVLVLLLASIKLVEPIGDIARDNLPPEVLSLIGEKPSLSGGLNQIKRKAAGILNSY